MPNDQMTEEQFLSLYLEGALDKVQEYKELIKNDSNLDISGFTRKCIEHKGYFYSFLQTYVVDLMRDNNLSLSHPMHSDLGVFVPMANYLQIRSSGNQLKALKELDDYINNILEESYPSVGFGQE